MNFLQSLVGFKCFALMHFLNTSLSSSVRFPQTRRNSKTCLVIVLSGRRCYYLQNRMLECW